MDVTTKPRLRSVAPDEKPMASRPRTVADAAKSGTHRELLVAMRDRIAQAVSSAECPPRDLASLTRRLQDIAREIAALDAQAESGEAATDGSAYVDRPFDASSL